MSWTCNVLMNDARHAFRNVQIGESCAPLPMTSGPNQSAPIRSHQR
jgi:hypothetical protein